MQWDDLRVFLAVAQAGSLRRASRALGVGQPTVIRHVRQLEQSLGARLFERTPDGHRLTDAGQAKVMGPGDGSIVVWFSSQIVLARITSPYPYQVPAASYDDAPRRNFVDQLVLDKLESLRLAPSPRSTDGEFLRRLYLGLLGTLPTELEVREFLADPRADKRDRWIDQSSRNQR